MTYDVSVYYLNGKVWESEYTSIDMCYVVGSDLMKDTFKGAYYGVITEKETEKEILTFSSRKENEIWFIVYGQNQNDDGFFDEVETPFIYDDESDADEFFNKIMPTIYKNGVIVEMKNNHPVSFDYYGDRKYFDMINDILKIEY